MQATIKIAEEGIISYSANVGITYSSKLTNIAEFLLNNVRIEILGDLDIDTSIQMHLDRLNKQKLIDPFLAELSRRAYGYKYKVYGTAGALAPVDIGIHLSDGSKVIDVSLVSSLAAIPVLANINRSMFLDTTLAIPTVRQARLLLNACLTGIVVGDSEEFGCIVKKLKITTDNKSILSNATKL